MELNEYLIKSNLDIIALNETNLKKTHNFDFNQYNIIRNDNETRRKGGIAIIVKKELNYEQIEINSANEMEILAIEITNTDKPILIISIYARPRVKLSLEPLTDVFKKYKEIIILGDFNSTHKNWYCRNKNQNGEILNNFINKYDLHIANTNEPTFKRSLNILDLCITTKKAIENIENFETCDSIESDHKMIKLSYRTATNSHHNSSRRKYAIVDWKKYTATLDNEQITNKYQDAVNIDEKAELLTKLMLEAYENAKIFFRTRSKPKILPANVLEKIKQRRRLRREFMNTRNPSLKTEINRIKKEIDEAIAEKKRNSWNDLCEKAKKQIVPTKQIWNKIKNINQRTENTNRYHKIIVPNIQNPTNLDIANEFGKSLNKTLFVDPHDFKHNREANNHVHKQQDIIEILTKISFKEFENVIKNLKRKSATGPDNIQYNHIKNSPKSFKQLILDLFNLSLEQGLLPEKWKTAKIIMIPKPNKPLTEINSYRPISLTSCFAKCLEKFIQNRIVTFLDQHNILSPHQSGFRKNHSTKDHILQLTNDIINNFNKYEYTGAVMFDLEKAFDKVWHQGLLYKLKQINTPSYLLNWIGNFLTNRSFYVQYNQEKSTKYEIRAGVPQGCIISPILFSIYISDISKELSDTHGLFADDISVWKSNKNLNYLEKLLQKEIDKVAQFCQSWCLSVNIAKTTYTVFTTAGKRNNYDKKYTLQLKLSNHQIVLEHNPKFLGITFDPKLSFANHLNNIETQIQKRIDILKVLKNKYWSSSTEFLLNFYKTFIRPLVDYANFPFIVANKSSRDALQIKQNKILRICLNSDLLDSTTTIHNAAKIELLEDRQLDISKRYLNKAIIAKSNKLILKRIQEQPSIDVEYNLTKNHTRQRKTTCLDDFVRANETLIKQINEEIGAI
jgi:hypothetical protein